MPRKKDPDSTSLQKGLKLFTLLLFGGRTWSLSKLYQEIRCSKQTVLRLLAQIEASGWGKIIAEKRGNQNFYYMPRPRQVASVTLNERNLAQLTLCRDFLAKLLPERLKNETSETILKAHYYLPEPDKDGLTKLWKKSCPPL
jgi:DNA-binding IclR family transcriptional regulator